MCSLPTRLVRNAATPRWRHRSYREATSLPATRPFRVLIVDDTKAKCLPSCLKSWDESHCLTRCRVEGKAKPATKQSDVPESKELYEQIGRLKVQLEWLKKKWPRTVTEARSWIDFENDDLSVREQCRLLGIQRSSIYFEPQPESEENLHFRRLMDEEHLKHPARGSRQMVDFLEDQGFDVNRKRVQRLMRKMGVEGMSPKRRTTLRNTRHQVYPYPLRGLEIQRPNQVWCSDITYIPMRHGFMYLVAVLDWYSRHVLSWRLSNSMDADFCVAALEDALQRATPEIFNTDQGSQFTSREHIEKLKTHGVAISMDGKSRAIT